MGQSRAASSTACTLAKGSDCPLARSARRLLPRLPALADCFILRRHPIPTCTYDPPAQLTPFPSLTLLLPSLLLSLPHDLQISLSSVRVVMPASDSDPRSRFAKRRLRSQTNINKLESSTSQHNLNMPSVKDRLANSSQMEPSSGPQRTKVC